ncbi:MAG TPA: MBL fold metallo-hydrolase [Telluria sp.]|nr:MBL fold metallo-hydrolase [Telluria sp.]
MKNALTFVNHACFHVENDDTLLLVDPWLEGPAFNNGWSLLDQSTSNGAMVERLASLGLKIYVWYSHEHPDHFSVSFVKALKQRLAGKVGFLFQQTKDKRVIGFLKANGFEAIECAHGRRIALGDAMGITVFPYENGDAWCVIDSNGRTILNLNDCAVRTPAACREIAKACGHVDILLTQFGYANWAGNPDQPELRRQAAEDKTRSMAVQIEQLTPKITIPFASFIRFSNADNAFLNDGQNTPQSTLAALPHPLRFLQPGDVLDLERDTNETLADVSAAAVSHWMQLAGARHQLLPAEAPDTLDNIGAAFAKYRQQVGKPLLYLPRALEMAGLIAPLSIRLTDLGQTVRASYIGGFALLEEGAPFHIAMSSANAVFLFKNEYGFNTTHVNGRFRTASDGALALFSRFFMPQNLVKNGYGTRHPFLTARYLAGSVLARAARRLGALAR